MVVTSSTQVSDVVPYADDVEAIVAEVQASESCDAEMLRSILRRYPREGAGVYSKNLLVRTYKHLCDTGRLQYDNALVQRLRMKPTRTISGVAPVTVLTKPYACPGKCIFCPTDVRMPKSYLPDEPGAMRAEQHNFDPYSQTSARINTLSDNGHSTDKIELLILGGTWSSYPRKYQQWFVKRCFDAINEHDSSSLNDALERNESARRRNVGLVIETRPDHITPDEIRWLRSLGVTKVQIGVQSLDDSILALNQRGHTVEHTRYAATLLRAAGFKIVMHWMPNLMGATPKSDLEDFSRLWDDKSLRPDEIKIYPCSLLSNADLYQNWLNGEFEPYSDKELIDLTIACKIQVPSYCRINRIYRDIPAPNIVSGSTLSNLRQVVQKAMSERGFVCKCIRCQEIRGGGVQVDNLWFRNNTYTTGVGVEHHLSLMTSDDKVAGYLRISLPRRQMDLHIKEIRDAAMVRELHVYGPALEIGDKGTTGTTSQHRGLGKRLLSKAESIASEAGFSRVAIIAAVGTREYYSSRGYRLEGTYMVKSAA